MKKVLILMAEKTGTGHKSSANAIKESIKEKTDDIEVIIYNAMTLMGKTGMRLENSYNGLTSNTPLIWKLTYEFTNVFNRITNYLIYKFSVKKFKKLIEETKPDLIISVHPMFNGSIAHAIKRLKINIPFFTYIIDLVKISKLWLSKKNDLTFCPTEKVYNKLVKSGFKREEVIVAGFPINKKFSKLNKFDEKEYTVPKVLMVSPSTKGKFVYKLALLLLDNFKTNLTIVAGNNKKQYNFLLNKLANKNVTILGYVDDMPKKLQEADIILTKAGPNMILEAVRMCVPVIVTGHILGQEEKNYKFITDNEYGLKCESCKSLKKAFEKLQKDNYKKLNIFRENEFKCKATDGADIAADYIIDYLK